MLDITRQNHKIVSCGSRLPVIGCFNEDPRLFSFSRIAKLTVCSRKTMRLTLTTNLHRLSTAITLTGPSCSSDPPDNTIATCALSLEIDRDRRKSSFRNARGWLRSQLIPNKRQSESNLSLLSEGLAALNALITKGLHLSLREYARLSLRISQSLQNYTATRKEVIPFGRGSQIPSISTGNNNGECQRDYTKFEWCFLSASAIWGIGALLPATLLEVLRGPAAICNFHSSTLSA